MMKSTSPSIPAGPQKPVRILACVLCQHRKIKCDRNSPCSNCIKANMTCTPSTPAPPRKRRRPNQDLQERLARCEELLKEYAASSASKPGPHAFLSTPSTAPTCSPGSSQDEYFSRTQPRLVHENGNLRFMDQPLFTHLHDELQSMREILDSQDRDEATTPPDVPNPDAYCDLVIGDMSHIDVDELHPAPVNVFRLWHIFMERVNPMVKVIHAPSMQPYLQEAANSGRNIPNNVVALIFSIYTVSVVALEDEECQTILGWTKKYAFHKFSTGVRAALHKLGFLVNYDLVTLQALVLYTIALQGRYDRHACWVLCGMVLRLALKMGLHRDGETMGLSPFETEMRRRLWWAIFWSDVRAAMFSGLKPSLMTVEFDTKIPANLNDSDMYITATKPFQDRKGPTDMVMCLIVYRMCDFMLKSPQLMQDPLVTMADLIKSNAGQPSTPHLDWVRRRICELGKRLSEDMETWCDPSAGPLHLLAHKVFTLYMEKVRVFADPNAQSHWLRGVRSSRDSIFALATYYYESQLAMFKAAESTGFLWVFKMNFFPEMFAFLLTQLCHVTPGPLTEKAWEHVRFHYKYHAELFDMSDSSAGRMAGLTLRAWRKRESDLMALTGQIPDVPDYIQKLERLAPQDRSGSGSDVAQVLDTPKGPELAPASAAGMVWEPMFGGYVDFANFDWNFLENIHQDPDAKSNSSWHFNGL